MPTSRFRRAGPARLRWPWRTARLRLTALYCGLFLLSGAALVATTYGLFERATEYGKPQLPRIPQTPAIQSLQVPNPPGKALALPQVLLNLSQDQDQLARAQHQLNLLVPPRPTNETAVAPPEGPLMARLTQDQQQLTDDQQQLSRTGDQLAEAVHQIAQAGSVQTAQRATDSHELLVDSGIALAVVAALALLAGWLVAGRMLRPIRTITRTAQRISSSNLHQRLALHGPSDELKELGDTLDDLFERLDAAFEAQRHFIANASHELRTPLTAERNLLQVALDDPHASEQSWRATAKELLASNDEQKDLIEALLALASSESALDNLECADLADICQTVLSRPGLDADNRALHIETAIHSAPIHGDPRLIERLVSNLVDNAVRHNVDGGCIRVSTDTTDGQSVLSVTNTGPIIPPDEIDRLFQPFQRPGRSSRPMKSTASSNRFSASTAAAPTTTAATASGYPLSELSPAPTTPPSPPCPCLGEDCPYQWPFPHPAISLPTTTGHPEFADLRPAAPR